jgi:hypothetical protein
MLRIATATTLSIAFLALSTEARAESRSIELPSFTSARFNSQLNAKIVVGDVQSITIEAADGADLDDVRYDVVNGQLRMWTDRDFFDVVSFRSGQVVVTITVPSLTALEASGASRVTASGLTGPNVSLNAAATSIIVANGVESDHVRINASSVGQVYVSGSCEMVEAEVSSAATVNAGGLKCVDADVVASSASLTTIYASGLVTADASSAARVLLAGHPLHVDDEEASSGNVTILD